MWRKMILLSLISLDYCTEMNNKRIFIRSYWKVVYNWDKEIIVGGLRPPHQSPNCSLIIDHKLSTLKNIEGIVLKISRFILTFAILKCFLFL